MIDPLYYYGCWDEAGHYLHDKHGKLAYSSSKNLTPFGVYGEKLDGTYAPPDGSTALVHVNGWTVLSMTDYSVDHRPGSNANFAAEGKWSAEQMWEAAARDYPQIVKRLKAAPKA